MKKISWFVIFFAFFVSLVDVVPAVATDCSAIVCGKYKRGGTIEQGLCEDKSVGDQCDDRAAEYAKCVYNKKAGDSTLYVSCSARICKEGYLLWLYGDNIDNAIPYGRCRSKEYLQHKFCDKGKEECRKAGCDNDCVLKKQTYPWPSDQGGKGRTTAAFVDNELCTCGTTATTPAQNSCTYIFRAYCDNDKSREIYIDGILPITIDLTQTELEGDKIKNHYGLTDEQIKQCKEGKVFEFTDGSSSLTAEGQGLFDAFFDGDVQWLREVMAASSSDQNLKQAIKDFCKQPAGVEEVVESGAAASAGAAGSGVVSVNTSDTAAINNAKAVLSAFFAKAESDVSVWKNAEGKFNTARLASDLTAGVVLGTVGGLVSSVVIKKAQVKKGFEALQCYIHGYKVADWGDVFEASLRTK